MYFRSEFDAPMIEAACMGDLEKLKELKERIGEDDRAFRKRCDLVNDCEGLRVLHIAAGMGNVEMCKFLIEKVNVEIDVKTERGDTPLLHAAKGGHVKTAEYLINQGAEIAVSDSKGFTSLHYAVENDNKELMQLLLTKGADIKADSVSGTPLQCAASSGSVGTVKFLLGHDAEPNSVCMIFGSPLICAIISHSSECMELLLKAGADPNKSLYGISPLAHAAAEGETEFLKSLLAAGANPNSLGADHLRPIEHAALAHNHEGVRILFPVTQRIPNYPNWSVDGIMEYYHSGEAKTKREQMRDIHLDLAKQKGKSAFSRQDYVSAVRWYNEAIFLDPSDEKMLSNRSLCWGRLGKATFALRDAEECVRLKPDWAKAHYREGAAWKLLGNYRMSSIAFCKAWKLAPQDDEIQKAYNEIVGTLLLDMAEKYPAEARSIFQDHFG